MASMSPALGLSRVSHLGGGGDCADVRRHARACAYCACSIGAHVRACAGVRNALFATTSCSLDRLSFSLSFCKSFCVCYFGFCGCALALVLCWFGRLQAGGLSVGCLCGYPLAFLARWSMYVDRLAGVTAPNPQTNAAQD